MSALFTPLVLRSLGIRNRVWMAPMCQYSAPVDGEHTGAPGDWHFTHLATRAVGGAGLVMTEGTAVTAAGRITPADLGLWNDTQQAAFQRIAQGLRALGSVPAIQLTHAGRKASTARPWDGGTPLTPDHGGWHPVGPSPLPYAPGHLAPHELTVPEIHRIVDDFARAARRALDAGFQVAEVHGAHGYLIHQFLSPYTNRRGDQYGGSFSNRTRFALEVVDAVRSVWPDGLPVFFRASATDWLERSAAEGQDPAGRSRTPCDSPSSCWTTAWTCSTSPPEGWPPGSGSRWPPATRSPSPQRSGTSPALRSPPSASSPTRTRRNTS